MTDSTLEFGGGTHSFLTGATFSGEMLLTAATLEFVSGDFTLDALTQAGGTLTGDGTVTMTDRFEWRSGTHRGSGTTRAEGGMLITGTNSKSIFDTRAVINDVGSLAEWRDDSDTTFVGNGISMTSTAVLQNDGTFNVTRTSVTGGDHFRQISGGAFVNNGVLDVNVASGDTVRIGSAVSNPGTISVQQGTLEVTGPLDQHVGNTLTGGTYRVFDNGNLTLTSSASGRTDITNSSADITLSGPNSSFARIDGLAANNGSFSLLDGRIFTTVGDFANSGDVAIGDGGSELNVSGNYTQTGGATAVFGKLETIGAGTVDIQSGSLIGDGTVVGDVTNAGTIAPEGLIGTTGGLSILGEYTQLTQGTFAVEIGGLIEGDEYDFLDVSGTANLAGTLEVTLADLFTPETGDFFDILRADAIGTEFDILMLAPLDGNLFWDVEYLRDPIDFDVVRLTAKVVPLPAAVWLFGSGIIGLVGLARRRRVAA